MSFPRSIHFFSALLFVVLAACGDDDTPPMSDAGPADGGPIADGGGPDGGPAPTCTVLPTVVDTGMTAPTSVPIDFAMYETDATTIAFDPTSIPESATDFPIGISAGSVTAGSAMLWTRTASTETTVLRVWRETTPATDVVLVHESDTAPDANGYVHATADALAPSTVYRYAFFVDDGSPPFLGRSAIGRFRTAPADDIALTLRFGATTCTGTAEGYGDTDPGDLGRRYVLADTGYPALQAMAAEELDALLHLGDMSYNDPAWDLAEAAPVADLAEIYRGDAGWQFPLENDGYRAILTSTSIYNVWDDHEITDSGPLDDILIAAQTDPDTAARVDGAIDAFYETLPVERGPEGQLWRSVKWGSTAEIFLLDLRTERDPSTLDGASPVFISTEQLDWLKGALSASTAHFKLILSSVNITHMPEIWDLAANDRWEGYRVQREELLDHIETNAIDDVWFLAGDIHVGFVGRLEPEGTSPWDRMWEITVGPGGSATNPLSGLIDSGILEHEEVFPCTQFVFSTVANHVATTLELDPLADTIRVRFVDAMTDEVLFDEVLQQE